MSDHVSFKNQTFYGSSYMKIRPQAKLDNFDFKNSNIIIEGLI